MFSLLAKLLTRKSKGMQFTYEEKKYPFGVLVLLVFMTGVLLMLGERALSDLSDGIPQIPYPDIENIPAVKALRGFERDTYWPLVEKKNQLEHQIGITRGEYDSRLLEKIAREPLPPLYGPEGEIRKDFQELSTDLRQVEDRLKRMERRYEELRREAREGQKPVMREYEWKVRWRQAKVFVWEALFWIPFFLLSLLWHTRSCRREGRWELISLSSLIAASILALQSVCIVMWSWIPKEFLEWLWELIRATLLTRVVGYYIMMVVAIVLFGGLIVFIHRKLTNPIRTGKRRVRHGWCPACSYPLSLSERCCGGCGMELRTKCRLCKKEGYIWAAKCVYCGK